MNGWKKGRRYPRSSRRSYERLEIVILQDSPHARPNIGRLQVCDPNESRTHASLSDRRWEKEERATAIWFSLQGAYAYLSNRMTGENEPTEHRVDVGFAVVIEFFAYNLAEGGRERDPPRCGDNLIRYFEMPSVPGYPAHLELLHRRLRVWSTGVCIDSHSVSRVYRPVESVDCRGARAFEY